MVALVGTLTLIIYAAALGTASVLTWRYGSGWARWVPAVLTALYYLLSYLYPHPVIVALWNGAKYPPEDALRAGVSTLALVVSLAVLGHLLRDRGAR